MAIVSCGSNTTYSIRKYDSSNRFRVAESAVYPDHNEKINVLVNDDELTEAVITTSQDTKYLIVQVSNAAEEPRLLVKEGIEIGEYEAPNSIELYQIDDYEDVLFKNEKSSEYYNSSLVEGAWYKKNTFVKFNGGDIVKAKTGTSIRFINSTSYSDDIYWCLYNNVIQNNNYIENTAICNYFSNSKHYMQEKIENTIQLGTSLGLCVKKADFENADAVNQFFIDNSEYIELYVALKNPTYIQITDETLIAQLEALHKFRTEQGINHIWTEAEELEPNLEFTYKQSNLIKRKEQDAKLENIESRLALLE